VELHPRTHAHHRRCKPTARARPTAFFLTKASTGPAKRSQHAVAHVVGSQRARLQQNPGRWPAIPSGRCARCRTGTPVLGAGASPLGKAGDIHAHSHQTTTRHHRRRCSACGPALAGRKAASVSRSACCGCGCRRGIAGALGCKKGTCDDEIFTIVVSAATTPRAASAVAAACSVAAARGR